jgi:type II restriction/modification system DNA methylase subunit YeeA
MDITRRSKDKWIIDFGWEMSEREASLFEAPFQYVKEHVSAERATNRRDVYRRYWWRHVEPRPALRTRLNQLDKYLATARVAKHRLFAWLPTTVLPDSAIIAITRSDDATFGILQSRFHEHWSLRLGTSLEDRPRYTPTTTFETFPFPEGLSPNILDSIYSADPRASAIAQAARCLNDLRNAWLNPADLVRIEREVVSGYPDRTLPKDTDAAVKLRERTLTNLYNQQPQWLIDAHRDLDCAVAAAYGWNSDISEEDALRELLDLNLSRSGIATVPEGKPYTIDPESFEKISEVEGVHLSPSMKRTFAELDADGSSRKQRQKQLEQRLKQMTP